MTFIAIPQALEGEGGFNLSMFHKILRLIWKNVANFARLQTSKVTCTCAKEKYWGGRSCFSLINKLQPKINYICPKGIIQI